MYLYKYLEIIRIMNFIDLCGCVCNIMELDSSNLKDFYIIFIVVDDKIILLKVLKYERNVNIICGIIIVDCCSKYYFVYLFLLDKIYRFFVC